MNPCAAINDLLTFQASPFGLLGTSPKCKQLLFLLVKNTEKVGFEPTVPFSITGFQDQLLKPLGHLSRSYFVVAANCDLLILPFSQTNVNTFFLFFLIFFLFLRQHHLYGIKQAFFPLKNHLYIYILVLSGSSSS